LRSIITRSPSVPTIQAAIGSPSLSSAKNCIPVSIWTSGGKAERGDGAHAARIALAVAVLGRDDDLEALAQALARERVLEPRNDVAAPCRYSSGSIPIELSSVSPASFLSV
jgi:hypothetical protein